MNKTDAIRKIKKLELEIAECVDLIDGLKSHIENCQHKMIELKHDFNIGNTILDEALLNHYKSESRTVEIYT